jgi:glycogen debranching enzyme
LPNQTLPQSEKTNADSIGWLFKRIQDYKKWDKQELALIKNKLEFSIDKITKNYMKNGLIYSNPLETWMDTEWAYDNHSGFRIEIQALFLNMLSFAYKLTKKKKYKIQEEKMKELVKRIFFNGVYLIDGFEDWTKRPNVFIAAYIYPGLLSKKEWIVCFKSILKDLWLPWGGLSTIDFENPLFCSKHTGEIPQSYHRGDSWFWLNNLAAIVLHRTDKKVFKNYISKIFKASSNKCSELSSASKLSEEGCLYQTWSEAMFVEMKKTL